MVEKVQPEITLDYIRCMDLNKKAYSYNFLVFEDEDVAKKTMLVELKSKSIITLCAQCTVSMKMEHVEWNEYT